jgi:hypothetical protein
MAADSVQNRLQAGSYNLKGSSVTRRQDAATSEILPLAQLNAQRS